MRRLIEQYPVFSMDEEREILNEYCAGQRRLAEIMAALVYPIEVFVRSLNFSDGGEPNEDDGVEGPGGSRARIVTPASAQTLTQACKAVRGANKSTKAACIQGLTKLILGYDYRVIRSFGYSVLHEDKRNTTESHRMTGLPAVALPLAKDLVREHMKLHKRMDRLADDLYHHNLRLVLKVVIAYGKYHSIRDDLLQEGSLGLYDAIYKYTEGKGAQGANTKLSTVAVPWIRHRVKREIDNKAGTICVPVYISARQRSVRRACARLAEIGLIDVDLNNIDNWTEEQFAAVSENTGIRIADVKALRDVPRLVSMNAKANGDEDDDAGIEIGEAVAADAPNGHVSEMEIDAKIQNEIALSTIRHLAIGDQLIAALRLSLANKQKVAIAFANEKTDLFLSRAESLLAAVKKHLPTPALVQPTRKA